VVPLFFGPASQHSPFQVGIFFLTLSLITLGKCCAHPASLTGSRFQISSSKVIIPYAFPVGIPPIANSLKEIQAYLSPCHRRYSFYSFDYNISAKLVKQIVYNL
jgi:hypothetical protein